MDNVWMLKSEEYSENEDFITSTTFYVDEESAWKEACFRAVSNFCHWIDRYHVRCVDDVAYEGIVSAMKSKYYIAQSKFLEEANADRPKVDKLIEEKRWKECAIFLSARCPEVKGYPKFEVREATIEDVISIPEEPKVFVEYELYEQLGYYY